VEKKEYDNSNVIASMATRETVHFGCQMVMSTTTDVLRQRIIVRGRVQASNEEEIKRAFYNRYFP
jgi:hypothetical protein